MTRLSDLQPDNLAEMAREQRESALRYDVARKMYEYASFSDAEVWHARRFQREAANSRSWSRCFAEAAS